jgi:hypothetical protein
MRSKSSPLRMKIVATPPLVRLKVSTSEKSLLSSMPQLLSMPACSSSSNFSPNFWRKGLKARSAIRRAVASKASTEPATDEALSPAHSTMRSREDDSATRDMAPLINVSTAASMATASKATRRATELCRVGVGVMVRLLVAVRAGVFVAWAY